MLACMHCSSRCQCHCPHGAGPYGTWKGGREKAPAAFCRKALTAVGEVEMWGDGKQTRSFTFIDDCVEGILRITKSDFRQPLNLGSCEMVRAAGGGARDGQGGCMLVGLHMQVRRDSVHASSEHGVAWHLPEMLPARRLHHAPGVDERHDADGDGL